MILKKLFKKIIDNHRGHGEHREKRIPPPVPLTEGDFVVSAQSNDKGGA